MDMEAYYLLRIRDSLPASPMLATAINSKSFKLTLPVLLGSKGSIIQAMNYYSSEMLGTLF